mmetsp:Transcript_77027/g.121625  ORF Transcript_77027/g.121625 Transcript_77027/m.121625 type:complete len:242 (-) Transcript_77027:58-783(-)|eukprot:CAMPEP_0169137530 /NCGR_PEP_ID=MMETSP1015-20121227/41597_1 /TAXON_ID=342587 /ORGANISM="Karlodinium micrum, Strain CCMP2283" /LENGTH=241 /DNA_ID=CAMNT_0009202399 /DNA_START=55 /DNA_END=780 /DNA_ORIENTATION=-
MAEEGATAVDGNGDPQPAKKEDPLAGIKAELDAQMRRAPYERFADMYNSTEFMDTRFHELVPCGQDQTFSGLTHATAKGSHIPHGWGVLEHHEGFIQACSLWTDGVPNGPGTWISCSQEQCGYGNWVNGKRDGFFSLVKEGGVYLEEYASGELKRRIKWRRDKLHKKCTRCNALFVASANCTEKLCRFHWDAVDGDGRFPCCGALQSVNPRGCATSYHVELESPEGVCHQAISEAAALGGQ